MEIVIEDARLRPILDKVRAGIRLLRIFRVDPRLDVVDGCH